MISGTSVSPDSTETPEVPEIPDNSKSPDGPRSPEGPGVPETPENSPEVPEASLGMVSGIRGSSSTCQSQGSGLEDRRLESKGDMDTFRWVEG